MLPRDRAVFRRGAWLALPLCALGCGDPEPPPWTSVAVRGHHDARRVAGEPLTPLFASTRDPLGICLRALPEVDTSRWRARLWWEEGDPGELAEATTRMAGTVCFDRQLPERTRGRRLEVCGEVVDAFDESRWAIPCAPVEVLADDAAYARLRSDLNRTLRADPPSPLPELLDSLEELSDRSLADGFPLLALRLQLVAAFYERTRGGAEGRTRAASRLASPPAWIDQPPASEWAAQVEQERHEIEKAADSPNWSRMWENLRRAADLFLHTADSRRFTVAMQQANLLARVGAVSRAIETLRGALDECSQAPCSPRLLGSARGNLAWLLITDPLAGEAGWAEAESILDELLADGGAEEDALTRANRLLNRAYLHLRRGRSLAAELSEARAVLASEEAASARTLSLWADLLDGEAALESEPDRALERCGRALSGAETARLAAWAAGCVAEARRRRGELEIAANDYEQTLRLHENASPASLDQDLSVDVGRRADDFFRAARVAVERGRAAEAWSLLERLDSLSVGAGGTLCEEPAEEPGSAARERELSLQLQELDQPASLERERQIEPVKRLLRQELAELLRRRRCEERPASDRSRLPGLRAVPLEDEILLLRRDASGAVRLVRRTPIERTEVTRIAGEIARVIEQSNLDDDEWRSLTAPLAEALWPERAADGRTTLVAGYWLHGSLQGIPLAALSRSSDDGRERWLGETVLPALFPADPRDRPRSPTVTNRQRTFVVDPRLDLRSGRRLADFYREVFPAGEVLRGEAATTAAVTGALRSSSWLHIDAHGIYDPAFPELSHLVLADGNLGLTALGGLSNRLDGANLLGCWTGAWPVTSDGGRHGLAGALARSGVPWTVASRTAVVDELAADFNEAFYPALKTGASVPAAYAQAMSVVRRRWPASQWSAIMLVAGESGSESGFVNPAIEDSTATLGHP